MANQYFQYFPNINPYQQFINSQKNQVQYPQQQLLSPNWIQLIYPFQNLIENNNKIYSSLLEVNVVIMKKCKIINQQFSEIEICLKINHLKNGKQFHKEKYQFGTKEQELDLKPSDMETEKLHIQLFGMKEYKYRLIFEERFSKTLYKDRNFSFKLSLVDNFGKKVKNSYFIPITLSAYNSNNIPEIILENKRGQPIFKGNYQTQLVTGQAKFHKIQFRQVTSIYLKRWIYFVIYPKQSPFKYKSKGDINEIDIDHTEISPLLVNKILVKSKKLA